MNRSIVMKRLSFSLLLLVGMSFLALGQDRANDGQGTRAPDDDVPAYTLEEREQVSDVNDGQRMKFTVKHYPDGRDVLHGKYVRYTNDVITEVLWYADGKLHGPRHRWSTDNVPFLGSGYREDGNRQLGLEREYVDGELHGKDHAWYANGIMAHKGTWVHGKAEGRALRWYSDGMLEYERSYKNGKLEGETVWHQNTGFVKYKRTFKAGIMHGSAAYWYENGQKESEGEYEDGKQTGPWTFWHENGHKESEGKYHNDTRVGEWKYWDDEGKLIRTEDHGEPDPERK